MQVDEDEKHFILDIFGYVYDIQILKILEIWGEEDIFIKTMENKDDSKLLLFGANIYPTVWLNVIMVVGW